MDHSRSDEAMGELKLTIAKHLAEARERRDRAELVAFVATLVGGLMIFAVVGAMVVTAAICW